MRYTDVCFFSLLPDTDVQHLVRIPTFSSWFSVWWHIPTSAFFHSYQIRMYNTCRCTINSTAVSLFVFSLVGGGTHDTYVPPVDAHVWRQLHVSAVARGSDSYSIWFLKNAEMLRIQMFAVRLYHIVPRLRREIFFCDRQNTRKDLAVFFCYIGRCDFKCFLRYNRITSYDDCAENWNFEIGKAEKIKI